MSTDTNKLEKTWYQANCHCGAVRYKIKLDNLSTSKVNSCNCSICTKNGYMLVYRAPSDVIWHSGYEGLKDYRFGKKNLDHKFCSNRGSSILIDFHNPERWADNARMIKDIDMDKLNLGYFDGKRLLQPPYEAP